MKREIQQIYDLLTDRIVINFIVKNMMAYNYPYLFFSYKIVRLII